MNALIRFFFTLLLLTLIAINNSFAGVDAVRPAGRLSAGFVTTVQKLDSFLSAPLMVSDIQPDPSASGPAGAASSVGRICSCQILNLESSNYNHRHIAVFAEKANRGASADFSVARKRINREKKQLRRLFYDKVRVVAELNSEGNCQSMYVRLKRKDSQLQVYEILNADIR